MEALQDPDRFVQADAARLLGELRRAEAVGPLVAFVARFGCHTKLVAFHALAQIGDASVCPAIRPLVEEPRCFNDWYWYGCKSVRAAAAVALLALGDEGGAAFLRQLAGSDDDVFFAWFAPAILRLPGRPPAAAELKARLTVEALLPLGSRKLRRDEPGALTMVAEALGLIGGPAACRKLRELMLFRSRYTRGLAAQSLLEADPTAENLSAVLGLAEREATDFARIKAHAALARAGRRESVAPVAAAAAASADAFDQATAVECLGLLDAKEHAALVRRQLQSPDPYVRRCAIEALERLDARGSREAVASRTGDPDPLVRLQAFKFLSVVEGGRP